MKLSTTAKKALLVSGIVLAIFCSIVASYYLMNRDASNTTTATETSRAGSEPSSTPPTSVPLDQANGVISGAAVDSKPYSALSTQTTGTLSSSLSTQSTETPAPGSSTAQTTANTATSPSSDVTGEQKQTGSGTSDAPAEQERIGSEATSATTEATIAAARSETFDPSVTANFEFIDTELDSIFDFDIKTVDAFKQLLMQTNPQAIELMSQLSFNLFYYLTQNI